MSKLNRKGFMLAEVIVVSTVILGTLVGLYTIFNRMYTYYAERSYYYNIDAVYAGRNIYKYLLDNENFVTLINDELSGSNYSVIITKEDDGSYECSTHIGELCTDIGNTYSIQKMILVRYEEDNFETESSLRANYQNDLINDYLNYLSTSMDFNESFNYIFITELADGDYHYYGNYRVR